MTVPVLVAKYMILPGDHVLPGGERIEVEDVSDVSLWRNPRHFPRAWIAPRLDDLLAGDKKSPDPFLRIVRYGPLRVEIEAELAADGFVVLCDQFYPGWELQVETAGQGLREVEILRTNRVMRAAKLPPGQHRLIYRYRPKSFLFGALISGLGWIALVLGAVWGIGVCHGRIGRAVETRP